MCFGQHGVTDVGRWLRVSHGREGPERRCGLVRSSTLRRRGGPAPPTDTARATIEHERSATFREREVGSVADERHRWTKWIAPHTATKATRNVPADDIASIRDALNAGRHRVRGCGQSKGRGEAPPALLERSAREGEGRGSAPRGAHLMNEFRALRDSGITWRFLARERAEVVQRESETTKSRSPSGTRRSRGGRFVEPFRSLPPELTDPMPPASVQAHRVDHPAVHITTK